MTRRQIAQHALALPIFAGEFGYRLFGAPVRLIQERRPQTGTASLETRLGITHGSQRFIDHALAFMAGSIDHPLRTGFGFQQALQLIVHRLTFPIASPSHWLR